MVLVRNLVLTVACAMMFAGARAEDKRIAVVNIATVFGSYSKVQDIQTKLKVEFEPRQKALDEDERAIKAALAKLQVDGGDPEDPVFFRSKLELEQRKFDFQVKVKLLYVNIEERRKIEMKKVLEEIKAAISAVGRQKKYDLVMRAPEFNDDFDPTKGDAKKNDESAKTAQELVQRFRENPVLYFAAGVDITTDVVEILNLDYKTRGGK